MLAVVDARTAEVRRTGTVNGVQSGSAPPRAVAAGRPLPMIDAIAKAQASGTVPDHFDAPVLFGLILSIAAMWQTHSPDFLSVVGVSDPKRRREIVREAVERLLVR